MKAICRLLLILLIGTALLGFASADTISNNTGSLQISSSPSGAEIYLDMTYKGVTPESGGFVNITNLSPYDYSLVLRKVNFQDYISTVKIVSGETVKVSANLQAVNATSTENPANPANPMVTVALVVVFLLIIIGFVALMVRKRRKSKKPEKIELD
jgi:hypothetical protein